MGASKELAEREGLLRRMSDDERAVRRVVDRFLPPNSPDYAPMVKQALAILQKNRERRMR